MAARETYVLRDGQLVPKREADRIPGAYVHSDGMASTWHPADGRHYDSKSQFRRATRAAGCIEVGNDRQTQRPTLSQASAADVGRAYQMVSQGYRPRLETE